ncbi:MAG: hypothetical protein ACP5PX_02605 [Candidatus Hadarchaeum sp.]|uniref:hypothetical protein n=1 Tax=Candidatus Hadarchaeum sp. TaxID=2883567 RepID=UPI003D0D0AC9
MKADIKKVVRELLAKESEGGLTKIKLDTVRALIHYHGAIWKSELVQELTLQATAAGPRKLDLGQLNKGLQELQSAGVVRVKKALRATLHSSGGVEDELISITDLHEAYASLAKDKALAPAKRA